MAEIAAFRGILYDAKKAGGLSKVVAPPYDVISSGMQKELYRASPYNVVRLILGKDSAPGGGKENKYKRAAKYFINWQRSEILREDASPAIYVYAQDFAFGKKKRSLVQSRVGFIALLKLQRLGPKKVYGHEKVFAAPRLDRFRLMKETRANFSPIFGVFPDESARAGNILRAVTQKQKPFIDTAVNGVRQRLWRVADKSTQEKLIRSLESKDVFIADGHHRYEAAMDLCIYLNRRFELPHNASCNYVMAYLTSSTDKGLLILPTHRVIRRAPAPFASFRCGVLEKLSRYFNVISLGGQSRLAAEMAKRENKAGVFGMYAGGGEFYLLEPKKISAIESKMTKSQPRYYNRIDTVILHDFVFDKVLRIKGKVDGENNILYTSGPREVVNLVKGSEAAMGFFLNPTKISQVVQAASLKRRMPAKSTYFYPKPLSGLVMRRI